MTGPIRGYEFDELARAQVRGPGGLMGSIPTIAELLNRYPDARWAIDVKHSDSIVPLAGAINATNSADRVCVAHSWSAWLDRIRELTSPRLERSAGWEELAALVASAREGSIPPSSLRAGPWVHIGWRIGATPLMESPLVAERIVSMSHDLGMGVRVWTINEEDAMARLVEQGVDGIFTDRPDVALRLTRGA